MQEASWSADELESAVEAAREVVRGIREMAFDDFGRLGGWRHDCATEAILGRGQITSTDPFARLNVAEALEQVARGGGGS